MIGKTINGYTIKRLIGSGGMADVYYAENRLEVGAAIKVLKRKYSDESKIVERFTNEAKIMRKLDHLYICKVMDLGELDGQPCIIMEYLEGGTLKEVMGSHKKVDDASLQKYFDQCAQALIYTHSKGITHRDIKPSNIFITKEGVVKLVDFGIAKSELGISHTLTGQTLGTVIYMSPEQVMDPKRVTGKTDIYSLGVTFYHALLGKSPYDETTGSEFTVMRKIVDEDLDLKLIPSHWKPVLAGCLQKKPEDRKELKAKNFDEETIVEDGQTPTPRPSTPQPPSTGVSHNWLYFLIGGLVLALGMIFAIRSCNGEIGLPSAHTPTQKAAAEIEATMVRIPGGTFTMGCTREQGSDCWDDEKPTHQVTVSGFSMNKYVVTQGQWRAIMGGDPPELYNKGCDRCPVERVSWNEVQEFIRKLNNLTGRNYRLPTEAEWEYAARGGNQSRGYKYSGSNNIGEVAWYDKNYKQGNTHGEKKTTRPVGGKNANELGLYDMSGNVWEWCSDRYGSYSRRAKTNPKGPSTGSNRVNRGGSWYGYARYCRVSYRDDNSPGIRYSNIGFRLAE